MILKIINLWWFYKNKGFNLKKIYAEKVETVNNTFCHFCALIVFTLSIQQYFLTSFEFLQFYVIFYKSKSLKKIKPFKLARNKTNNHLAGLSLICRIFQETHDLKYKNKKHWSYISKASKWLSSILDHSRWKIYYFQLVDHYRQQQLAIYQVNFSFYNDDLIIVSSILYVRRYL